MHLLSVRDLSFSWGYKSLINHLNFHLDKGQVLGIAGPNGCGKSTLINLIQGLTTPDEGEIQIAAHARCAAVVQQSDFGSATTVADYLLARVSPLAQRLEHLETALSQTQNPTRLSALLADFGQAQEAFEAAGGYQAHQQAERLLERTGLSICMDQALTSLSGGEASVLAIVQALVAQADILILDEPGNHLDYLGLAWLEQFLTELDMGILLISHNRYLLDHAADSILYLEAGRHWLHKGSYSSFRESRAAALIEERKAYQARARELHELNIILKDLQHRAAQSYNPPPKVMIDLGITKKKIARLQEIHDQGLTPVAPPIRIKLNSETTKGETALNVSRLSLAFGTRQVLKELEFVLYRGDRVALVGLNGSGKSSLIRLICEQAGPDNPQLRLSPAMKIGYLSQHSPFMEASRSLIDEVRSWGALSQDAAFKLIAPFAFSYDELDKPIATLSGGELQRLQLARLSYSQVNFLILDEPSNHLDIPSRESLEACIAEFDGTMLIVSHDRYFLDSFARRILFLDQGNIQEYEGNFSAFLDDQQSRTAKVNPHNAETLRSRDDFTPKHQRDRSRETGRPPFVAPKANEATLETQLQALEDDIRQSEQHLIKILASDTNVAFRIEEGLKSKRDELEKLYAKWLKQAEV